MHKFRLFIFLIIVQSIGLKSQTLTGFQYEISLKALKSIENFDTKTFKECLDNNVFKSLDDNLLKQFMEQGAGFIKEYGYPDNDKLRLIVTETEYNGNKVPLYILHYPFPNIVNPTDNMKKSISFSFCNDISKDKIVGFRTHNYTFSKVLNYEEAKKNSPHQDVLDFTEADIDWFRIYYNRGETKNNLGNKNGVYAVSGDLNLLGYAHVTYDRIQL